MTAGIKLLTLFDGTELLLKSTSREAEDYSVVVVDDDSNSQSVGCIMTEILKHWSIALARKTNGHKGGKECFGAKDSKECSPSGFGKVALPRRWSDLGRD